MGKEMEVIKDIEEDVKRIKGDLRKINPEMKEIETKIEVLGKNIKENIKDIIVLNDKSQLEENEMAIYMFYYIEGSKFLKIGKANQKSKARFSSQHYSINAARSTLARSLYNHRKDYKDSNFSKIKEINFIKKKGEKLSKEVKEEIKVCNEIIRDWINKKCLRINIKIDTKGEKLDEFILEYFEAYFHVKYNPKYEGKENNN